MDNNDSDNWFPYWNLFSETKMSIDWSHLPKEVIEKICMCIGRDRQDGYSLDEESGYWVHAGAKGCHKPSVLTAVLECDECGKAFVPDKQKTVEFSFLGVACKECENNEF